MIHSEEHNLYNQRHIASRMGYDIILGRNASDREKFGKNGLINLGKGFVTMGQYTSLSNRILMDIARSHVVLVAGKRGGGKSYTLGVMAEELTQLPPDAAQNIASLMFDTMGIFWTMKYKNEKDKALLDEWELEPRELPIKVFVPFGKKEEYKKKGVPIDETFALSAAELTGEDWILTFNLEMTSETAVIIQSAITSLAKRSSYYSLTDIQNEVAVQEGSKSAVLSAKSLFRVADTWGIFAKPKHEATKVEDLISAGKSTVLDISAYSAIGSFNVRALVISLISRSLFKKRMDARKAEEVLAVRYGVDYSSKKFIRDMPLVWIFIDEAHEFLPKTGKTPATDALVQILREGRQPGISLVLATQQPGQIHGDVMTQSDIVLSHRVTAKPDVQALNQIMQTYVLDDIQKAMDELPSLKGSAIILDDNSERIYPMRIRPKFTWHGGESPMAVRAEQKF